MVCAYVLSKVRERGCRVVADHELCDRCCRSDVDMVPIRSEQKQMR